MIPQLIVIASSLISLGIMMNKHGKPKEGKESVWWYLFNTIIAYSLLIWGGFFDKLF